VVFPGENAGRSFAFFVVRYVSSALSYFGNSPVQVQQIIVAAAIDANLVNGE
jgi:hypothetical protein